jgi:hypothetical protein
MSGFIFGGVNWSKIELFYGGFRDYNKANLIINFMRRFASKTYNLDCDCPLFVLQFRVNLY